jgi:type I restriction enzyme, S subunit
MKTIPINELLTAKISGEWGAEADENSHSSVFVIRTANFLNTGKINFDNVVRREIDEKKVRQKN